MFSSELEYMEDRAYKIGEVAQLLHLKTHVLRFWEKEFPQIDPIRTDKGQRLYTLKQIAILRRIQQLLHEQGMTIGGARRVLEGSAVVDENSPEYVKPVPDPEFMRMITRELLAIRKILEFADNK